MFYYNLTLVLFVIFCFFLYKKIFPKKKINFIILLLIIGLLSTLSIFRDGTYRSGDMTAHVIHFIDFYQNLIERSYVPQWAGNLCGGYGCPIFMIEYIFPYYIASFFHFIGLSFLMSIKLVLVIGFVASGITMYLWAKEQFGKIPGLVSAIFYLYAPYHLIDFHFRGSIGEVLSFVFIPLLFLFIKRLIEFKKIKYFFLEALIVFLLILTHSSTTLISLPLAIGYGIIVWIMKKKKHWRELAISIASILYGISLATFYWLPALEGVRHTWWIYTTFGDFKPITEYLFSPDRYGFLFQGNRSEYRLIIGYFHASAILFAVFLLIKNKIEKHLKPLLIYFLLSFAILFFMLLEISKPIWENISLLHTFIVVWRLLVPLSFITAAIAGIVAKKITNIKVVGIISFFVILSTILNWANRAMVPFNPNPFIDHGEIYTEYFEKGNPSFEESFKKGQNVSYTISHPPKQPMDFLKGKGEFVQLKRTQVEHEYVLQTSDSAVIRENTNYFPGWKVFVNNKEVFINYRDKNDLGKIIFNLKKGVYKITVEFTHTPIVRFSGMVSISLASLGILFLLFYKFPFLINFFRKRKIFDEAIKQL